MLSTASVFPVNEPVGILAAGQVLNEPTGPHKVGASAPGSCLLPGLSMEFWVVWIQSLGFHPGPARYPAGPWTNHSSSVTQLLGVFLFICFRLCLFLEGG